MKYLFCTIYAGVYYFSYTFTCHSFRRTTLFQFPPVFAHDFAATRYRDNGVYEKKIEVSSNISVIAGCDIAMAPTYFTGLKREYIGVARSRACVYVCVRVSATD